MRVLAALPKRAVGPKFALDDVGAQLVLAVGEVAALSVLARTIGEVPTHGHAITAERVERF